MRHLMLLGVLAAVLMLGGASARAATSIYYSANDSVFGWCAGYPIDQANSCARGNCVKFGGTQCKVILTCDGGWGAVALADAPLAAVGASCGLGSAFWARTAALTSCAAAAHTLCWSQTIFDANGREA